MTTRKGWSKSLSGFARQVERDLTDMQKRVATEALQMVILGSPVDSGAFRGNHRVSVGSPDTSFDESAVASQPPKGGMDNETFNREAAKIAPMHVPFTVIYIQNNLPYAERIEVGSSDQAGEGVYAVAANTLREKYGG
tara:strand:+ start:141 stop:554 length:414 start_codon:yes stop_codon:yes gene_type:complete